jgi:hypothetical protein
VDIQELLVTLDVMGGTVQLIPDMATAAALSNERALIRLADVVVVVAAPGSDVPAAVAAMVQCPVVRSILHPITKLFCDRLADSLWELDKLRVDGLGKMGFWLGIPQISVPTHAGFSAAARPAVPPEVTPAHARMASLAVVRVESGLAAAMFAARIMAQAAALVRVALLTLVGLADSAAPSLCLPTQDTGRKQHSSLDPTAHSAHRRGRRTNFSYSSRIRREHQD